MNLFGSRHVQVLWHAWPVVLAALALTLLASCTSGRSTAAAGSSSAASSTGTPSAVAFSACMRSHGIPNYPDPDSDGQLPKTDAEHLGVSDSVLQAANQACQPLVPTTGSTQDQLQECLVTGACSQAQMQQALNLMQQFAQCMRSQEGVTNWPDPTLSQEGRPVFTVSKDGIDHHSPQMEAKMDQCQRRTGSPLAFQG